LPFTVGVGEDSVGGGEDSVGVGVGDVGVGGGYVADACPANATTPTATAANAITIRLMFDPLPRCCR
jgi:hypothetical protein